MHDDGDPARDAHSFRPARLTHPVDTHRLAHHLNAAGFEFDAAAPIEQFSTGLANLNFRIVLDGKPAVLRRPPDGDLPPGAHDMSREHRILSRLHAVLPLAPRSLHLCEDTSVLGVPFQIMEYRPGLIIKADDRRQLDGHPDRCSKIGNMLLDTLISIHHVDADAIGLGELGRPEGFLERAVSGWRKRAARLPLDPATRSLADEVGNRLATQRFMDRPPVLLHCDFKLDNVILDPETFAPRAVIDWDMGTRGDPLFDLATMLSYWTEPHDPPCMHQLRQMPTAAPGFPSRDEIVTGYAQAMGIDVSDFPAIRILAIYKLAIVFLQLHALRGRGPDADPAYQSFAGLGHDLLEYAQHEHTRTA